MPRIIHIAEHNYIPSFRAACVAGMFDIPVSEKLTKKWDVTLPIEEKPWLIGLITGASGSGKTTIAHTLFLDNFHTSFKWSADCLLDDFPDDVDVKRITEILSKVGFSSPPSWLLPYDRLSNGQKFKVELARCLLSYTKLFVFDEFTSFVDRQSAQIAAFAFQKVIRKLGKQFVAVTCHHDVEEWLQPDWVFNATTNEFKWGCLRRPQIEYKIQRVDYKAWKLFQEHHYLTGEINKAAICFCGFINDQPVAFDAWIPFFGRLSHGKAMRGHRTVVLPDFQGLGLGNTIFSMLASMWAGLDYRVFSNTAHPAEISKRIIDANWRITRQGRTGRDGGKHSLKHASNRLTCGFEFCGMPMDKLEAQKLYAKN